MHSLLVCVSALCFFQLFVEGTGTGTPLCQDCRVQVVYSYPGGQQLVGNQRIVRIINEYRQVGSEQTGTRKRALQDWDFSFIAKVRVADSIHCSAALVAPRVLITSSACFRNETAHQLEILFSGGRIVAVDAIVKPEFCPELTLLHLDSPSEVHPVDISRQSPKMGNNVSMLMASPDLSYYGHRHSEIIENHFCKVAFQEEKTTNSTLCAKNSLKPDHCANDPGDSLLMDHQLCGINAYGSRCQPNSLTGDLYIDLANIQPMIGDLIKQLNA